MKVGENIVLLDKIKLKIKIIKMKKKKFYLIKGIIYYFCI